MRIWRTEQGLFGSVLCAALLCVAVMTVFTGETADTAFHLMRTESLAQYFQDGGHYPCRLYRSACEGFGYASPLYYGDVTLIPFAWLRAHGVGRELCYEILIGVFSLLPFVTMLGMLLVAKVRRQTALWGALFYAFLPLVINRLAGHQIGAAGANIFLPLVFVPLWRLADAGRALSGRRACGYALLMAVGFSGILGSHVISLALTLLMAGAVVLVHFRQLLLTRKAAVLFAAGVLALLWMAWFWVPFLEQMASCTLSVNARGWDARPLADYALSPKVFFLNNFLIHAMHEAWGTAAHIAGRDFSCGWFVVPLLFFAVRDVMTRAPGSETVRNDRFGQIILALLILMFIPPFWRWMTVCLGWVQFLHRFNPLIALFLVLFLVRQTDVWRTVRPEVLLPRLKVLSLGLIVCLGLLLVSRFGFRLYTQAFVCKTMPERQATLWHVEDVKWDVGMGEYVPYRAEQTFFDVTKKEVRPTRNVVCDGKILPFGESAAGLTVTVPQGSRQIEVPKFYYKGYAAVLDGVPVPVTESSRGLLRIEPDGRGGRLCVTYAGTVLQRVSNWISALSVAGTLAVLLVFMACRVIRARKSR